MLSDFCQIAIDNLLFLNYCLSIWKVYGISASFVRKGRATGLEGNFGTQKQHYSLSKIKARNRKIEILWIFFGIHTANAILMIDKIKNRQRETA